MFKICPQKIVNQDMYFRDMHFRDMHFRDMHPIVVSIRGEKVPNMRKIPAGRFAVMYTAGYFSNVWEQIPSLLKYIKENSYRVGGDCYALKIWENAEDMEDEHELMAVQIPIYQ